MKENGLKAAGLVCLLFAGVLLAGPTFGFASVAADRGILVDTAPDDQALLGIEVTYDDEEVSNTPLPQANVEPEILELTNRFGTDIDEVDISVTDVDNEEDNTLEIANRGALLGGIDEDETEPVELGCSGDVTASGTTDVTVTISQATSSDISLSDKLVTITEVQYDCETDDDGGDGEPEAAEPIEETDIELVGTDLQGDRNSVVVFDVENQGESVTVTGIEARDTSSNAEQINDGGNLEVVISIDDETVGELNRNGGNRVIEIGGPQYDLDQDAQIEEKKTASFTLSRFQASGSGQSGGNIDMTGEDVDIVLYFEDRDPVKISLEHL